MKNVSMHVRHECQRTVEAAEYKNQKQMQKQNLTQPPPTKYKTLTSSVVARIVESTSSPPLSLSLLSRPLSVRSFSQPFIVHV